MAGAKEDDTDASNLFGVLRCIFCLKVLLRQFAIGSGVKIRHYGFDSIRKNGQAMSVKTKALQEKLK
jgi:hypothetical protein